MTRHAMRRPSCPLAAQERLAAAQAVVHMEETQAANIWEWDRQGLACSCTIDNMPSSTTCAPLSSSHCCHGAQIVFATIHTDMVCKRH